MQVANDETEYRDDSHITGPSYIDQSKVPSAVKRLSTWIRHKMFGKDVREAIARGIEKSSEISQNAVDVANDTASRQDDVDQSQKDFEDRYNNQIAGNTDINEVIDARKPVGKEAYKTVGKRLNAMDATLNDNLLSQDNVNALSALNSYYFDSKTQVGGTMPDYIKDAADDYVAMLKNNADDVLFGFITDDHYQSGNYTPRSLNHYSWFAEIARQIEPDFVVVGGDNINGDINYDYNQRAYQRVTETLNGQINSTAPIFWLTGNHDSGNGQVGRTPDKVILQDEMKEYLNTKNCPYGEVRDDDSLYFYKDLTDKKLRIIGLDGFDLPESLDSNGELHYNNLLQSGYQQKQIDFLVQALKLPDSDWQVIVFCHTPLSGNSTSEALLTGKQFNSDLVRGVLNAFEQGSTYSGDNSSEGDLPAKIEVDFTEQGKGTLIGEVTGHTHSDRNIKWNGINFITRNKASAFNIDRENDRLGSLDETAFDFVGINYAKRNMTFYRLGHGDPTLVVKY